MEPEVQRIRSFLLFPDSPSSPLDPCVGDGVAFEAITRGVEVLRYGIELDAYRAEQARERIPNINHYTPVTSASLFTQDFLMASWEIMMIVIYTSGRQSRWWTRQRKKRMPP